MSVLGGERGQPESVVAIFCQDVAYSTQCGSDAAGHHPVEDGDFLLIPGGSDNQLCQHDGLHYFP